MDRHDSSAFEGIVEDGVIRSPAVRDLPDGTRVEVRVIARRAKPRKAATPRTAGKRKSLASPELMKFAGIMKDAPRDASFNLDHYLYGAPKKKRR